MSADLNQNTFNLRTPITPAPRNEPYKLTFFVEDSEIEQKMEMTDFTESHSINSKYTSYYHNGKHRHAFSPFSLSADHVVCVMSAFLYFITITTCVYLIIVWIKHKMHVQMELMDLW